MNDPLQRALAALPDEQLCRERAAHADGQGLEAGATWPYLWPGGLRLAADLPQLLAGAWGAGIAAVPGCHVLDLGCGRGLLGMLALQLGFSQVSFADGDPRPLELLAPALAPYPGARCIPLHWGAAVPGPGADLILGGDVLYRPDFHQHLLATIGASLNPGGIALLGDPRSQVEGHMHELAAAAGCHCSVELRPGPYTLVILRRGDWDRQQSAMADGVV